MAKPDGGPAFPGNKLVATDSDGHRYYDSMPGMTLRDWFAGQALAGLTANQMAFRVNFACDGPWREAMASESYAMADAMLRERGRE